MTLVEMIAREMERLDVEDYNAKRHPDHRVEVGKIVDWCWEHHQAHGVRRLLAAIGNLDLRVVPVEPTPEMIEEFRENVGDGSYTADGLRAAIQAGSKGNG